jgi:uncharacterized protein (DUF1697 family)
MAELRACFEALGFDAVGTYIQSGNVLFSAAHRDRARLVATIERGLAASFGYDARVVVLSAAELAAVVAQAPPGFGAEPEQYRYDVLFVRPPVRAAQALAQLDVRPGVDAAEAGDRALYFRRLASRAGESRLAKLIQLPVYRELTIRNWNTTTRLLELAQG